MAGKRTVKRKGKSTRSKSRQPVLSPAMWRRIGMLMIWTGSIAGLVSAINLLANQVRAEATAQPLHVEWVDLPRWLPHLAYEDGQFVLPAIESNVAGLLKRDLLDPQLASEFADRLRASPWIARVDRVTKRHDGEIRVQAEFRCPAAYVDVEKRAYLVDTNGVRLPVEKSTEDLPTENWLLITGLQAPTPAVGEAWDSEEVLAALRLVDFIETATKRGEVPFRAWLRSVDVANYDGKASSKDGKLRIRTLQPQCYIDWGLPPGGEGSIDAPAARKLSNLRRWFAKVGKFPPKVIEARWPEDVREREP